MQCLLARPALVIQIGVADFLQKADCEEAAHGVNERMLGAT